jgi:hypothetical protein
MDPFNQPEIVGSNCAHEKAGNGRKEKYDRNTRAQHAFLARGGDDAGCRSLPGCESGGKGIATGKRRSNGER